MSKNKWCIRILRNKTEPNNPNKFRLLSKTKYESSVMDLIHEGLVGFQPTDYELTSNVKGTKTPDNVNKKTKKNQRSMTFTEKIKLWSIFL